MTDEAGNAVGYIITPGEYESGRKKMEQRRRDYDWARSVFTEERLAESRAAGGEFTYDEVLDYLRRLEQTEQARSA